VMDPMVSRPNPHEGRISRANSYRCFRWNVDARSRPRHDVRFYAVGVGFRPVCNARREP
jgi:hypothetical protein